MTTEGLSWKVSVTQYLVCSAFSLKEPDSAEVSQAVEKATSGRSVYLYCKLLGAGTLIFIPYFEQHSLYLGTKRV